MPVDALIPRARAAGMNNDHKDSWYHMASLHYNECPLLNRWVSASKTNSSALAIGLRLSCTNPSIWSGILRLYINLLALMNSGSCPHRATVRSSTNRAWCMKSRSGWSPEGQEVILSEGKTALHIYNHIICPLKFVSAITLNKEIISMTLHKTAVTPLLMH